MGHMLLCKNYQWLKEFFILELCIILNDHISHFRQSDAIDKTSVYSIGILFDFIIMLILLSSCPFLVDFIC